MSGPKFPPQPNDPASTPPQSSDPAEPNQAKDRPAAGGITRRGFLKGAGVAAAGTALLEGAQVFSREAIAATRGEHHGVKELGPGPVAVTLHVNGKEQTIQLEPRTTLADALRVHMGLTGTKVVCDRGSCSGCTVLLDDIPVNSCMTLATDAIGHHVTTIEGLSSASGAAHPDQLHPVQAAFIKHDAMQCGFCTPGMVMACTALLKNNPHPTEDDVRHATAGNLCRCGTYPRIFSATLEAAGVSGKESIRNA
ncbi:MAG TPA: (2Fe-2S)-binding protein [Acidobacteriaceae bacterium]|nr:(2Fe-2S)-binding protein [Acidobacteriaceae bacterium]